MVRLSLPGLLPLPASGGTPVPAYNIFDTDERVFYRFSENYPIHTEEVF